MKRIISISLVLAIIFSFPIYANTFVEAETGIINMLRFMEPCKNDYNLGTVNFSNIEIGNPIQAYEYLETGFEELFVCYPLFESDNLIAIAISVSPTDYQIITDIVGYINETEAQSATIIYDATSCYLYDGTDAVFLVSSGVNIKHRSELPANIDILENDLVVADLTEHSLLGYTQAPASRSVSSENANISLPVSYVSQHTGNLCWAATIACISNYVNGDAWTSLSVAMRVANSSSPSQYDVAKTGREVQNAMRDLFYLPYTYSPYPLDDDDRVENLDNEKPICARFVHFDDEGGGYSHFVTVYGINTSNHYIRIMNSSNGGAGIATVGLDGYNYIKVEGTTGYTWTWNGTVAYHV